MFYKCILAIASLLSSLSAKAADSPGTRKNPIKLAMVPSNDASRILSNMAPIAKCLEKQTGYYFDISVPNNFIVVVEGMGSKRVDVAFLNTFGYLLAHERYGAEALLKTQREGETTYQGEIVVRSNSNLKKIEDLNGKKIAYVDPASTSGYILAKKLLEDKKVKPAAEVFAGKHDIAITMVYQGQVDAAAAFYHKPLDGKMRDARKNILTQFPDVEKKISILTLTEEIPNDPIVVRKDLSVAMKDKIKNGFSECVKTNKDAFDGINSSDGLAAVKDSDYDVLRQTIKKLKIDLNGVLAPQKK